jgi:hypothetical protein
MDLCQVFLTLALAVTSSTFSGSEGEFYIPFLLVWYKETKQSCVKSEQNRLSFRLTANRKPVLALNS